MMANSSGTAVEPAQHVSRSLSAAVILLLLGACRGEPVPRDYQNAPPDMTHAPQTKSDTPSAHGMGQAAPEPSSGVEGTAGPYEQVNPPATQTTVSDTPPVTNT
jgi:hypothetical protein